jgi:hypothetical protein
VPTGRSETSVSDAGEAGFDRLARAAGDGMSRRRLLKLGGALALAAAVPAWGRTARAAVKKHVLEKTVHEGSCGPQPAGTCATGELRGEWAFGCAKPSPSGKESEFNGCGPQGGLNIPILGNGNWIPDEPLGLANFFNACKGHDCCYGRCGAAKAECDQNFLDEMTKACNAQWPTSSTIDSLNNGLYHAYCLAVAKAYYDAVSSTRTGQEAYEAGQKEVCECCVDCQAYAKTLGYYNYEWWRSCPEPSAAGGYECMSVCSNTEHCGACGNKCPETMNGGYTTRCQDGQCIGEAGALDYCTACRGESNCGI